MRDPGKFVGPQRGLPRDGQTLLLDKPPAQNIAGTFNVERLSLSERFFLLGCDDLGSDLVSVYAMFSRGSTPTLDKKQ
jgi:hypothetical protein